MQQWLAKILRFSDCTPGVERTACLLLAVAFLSVPLITVELYPFSRFPMFRDEPKSLVVSRAVDGHGHPISLYELGIIEVSVANPQPLLNLVPQRPLDSAYRFWREEEFVPHVQSSLAKGQLAGPIRFTQELLGRVVRDSRNTVEVVDSRSWEITSSEARQGPR